MTPTDTTPECPRPAPQLDFPRISMFVSQPDIDAARSAQAAVRYKPAATEAVGAQAAPSGWRVDQAPDGALWLSSHAMHQSVRFAAGLPTNDDLQFVHRFLQEFDVPAPPLPMPGEPE